MIEKLTKEQEAQIDVYKDKWLKIGLNTSPCNRKKAEALVYQIYENSNFPKPKNGIIWAKSPVDVLDKYKEYSGKDDIKDQINNFCFGAHDASWLSFYNFFLEVCNLEECKRLEPLMNLAEHCGWWLPYDEVCFCSEKPKTIHFNSEGVLHKDGGPAISFRDKFGIYSLNGVRVSKEIAETPATKLNPILVAKEKNVEVRRELVRKIGVERIYQKLGGKVIDKKNEYELVTLNLGDDRTRPFLKMENASVPGVFHLEGVPPNTKTVEEALTFRNGTDEKPITLT